jgi:hypothetical protein
MLKMPMYNDSAGITAPHQVFYIQQRMYQSDALEELKKQVA